MNDRLMIGAPPGSIGVPSATELMDSRVFIKYMNNFIEFAKNLVKESHSW